MDVKLPWCSASSISGLERERERKGWGGVGWGALLTPKALTESFGLYLFENKRDFERREEIEIKRGRREGEGRESWLGLERGLG